MARTNVRTVNAKLNPPTTIGKILRSVGAAAGTYFGQARLGADVGAGISRIFGQGDYVVRENSLMGAGPPAFASLNTGIRIAHREYIRDVISSTSFSNTTNIITPTNPTLFPWLSNIATNFEEFRIKGLIFYFNTTSGDAISSTNNALGVVGMTTVYDPTDSDLQSKREAEDYAGCVSSVPSRSFIHAVECKPSANVLGRYYIQTSSVTNPEDLKFYALGKLNLFTQGMQQANVTLGELWVSYDIEFYDPKILPIGTVNLAAGRISSALVNVAGAAFGPNLNIAQGNINFTTQNTSLQIPQGTASGSYFLLMTMISGGAGTYAFASPTVTSNINPIVALSTAGAAPVSSENLPESGATTQRHALFFTFNKTDSASATITLGGGGTITSYEFDVWLFKVPSSTFTGVQQQVPGFSDLVSRLQSQKHDEITQIVNKILKEQAQLQCPKIVVENVDGSTFDQRQHFQHLINNIPEHLQECIEEPDEDIKAIAKKFGMHATVFDCAKIQRPQTSQDQLAEASLPPGLTPTRNLDNFKEMLADALEDPNIRLMIYGLASESESEYGGLPELDSDSSEQAEEDSKS
jgi:hypothetical protein